MAIYSAVPPPEQQPQSGVDIAAWTVSALESLSVASDARGTGVSLSIPLDGNHDAETKAKPKPTVTRRVSASAKPVRDSQKNRDAYLKGKEGSRRRQRWENDRLLHVPNVQPPLPSDWEVRPTYPVHSVPYYLAPLWEAGVRKAAEERVFASKKSSATASPSNTQKGRVPQDLKAKLKKSKGAKPLLQDLECEIRTFINSHTTTTSKLSSHDASDVELDSEDEEIVFVGRNGTMSDLQRKNVEEELAREKLVWESIVGVDEGRAGFVRFMVHSLAEYYGLDSRSVTVGRPPNAKREAYVGIRGMMTGPGVMGEGLPRPLWGLI